MATTFEVYLNKKDIDHLTRRADFLSNRVKNYRAGGNPSYDIHELAILNKILTAPKIEDHEIETSEA